MYKAVLREAGASFVLGVAGDLVFDTAVQFAGDLRMLFDASDQGEPRIVDVSETVELDMTGIQLLYSAWKSADEKGCPFRVIPGRNGERFQKLYARTGLPSLPGEVDP